MLRSKLDLLTPLEAEAVNLLLAGEHPALIELRNQCAGIIKVLRTFTVVGFYSRFELANNVVSLPGEPSFAISDVSGPIAGTANGGGFVLFIESGRLKLLEGATFGGEKWPEQISHFELGYDMGRRDLVKLHKQISPIV